MQTAESPPSIELAQIRIETDGMVTDHNFPCPVCQERPAVLNHGTGNFEPCWGCQEENWFLIKINSRFLRWLLGIAK